MSSFGFFTIICCFLAIQASGVFGQGTLILTTGYAGSEDDAENMGRMVKALHLGDETETCSWKNNTALLVASTAGMVGDDIIICGGYDESKSSEHDSNICFEMGDEEDKVTMAKKRTLASSLVYGGSLWVTGGKNDADGTLKTTEWIKMGENAKAGPELPETMFGHCMTGINATHAMLIAKNKKTWAYNFTSETFTAAAPFVNSR